MKSTIGATERGSVMVVAMVAVFMVSALIMSLFTVVQSAAVENTAKLDRAVAMERSMSGLNRVMALIDGSEIENSSYLASLAPENMNGGQWLASGGDFTAREASVYVRSARNAGDTVPGGLFDVYVIDAFARVPRTPGADTDSYRGARAIVDIPYSGDGPGSADLAAAIPGACVTLAGLSLKGNAFVDGSDHLPATKEGTDTPTPSEPSNVNMDYQGSSAGYKSDFYAVSSDGATNELIFKGNKPKDVTGNTVFPANQGVNFAIKVYPGGRTPYWHYAFPRNPTDDRAIWAGRDGKYGTADDRNYCRVEQINDATYRLFFEDLEGGSADWDIGKPGDLECPTADQVVDVTFVPESESGGGSDSVEAWSLDSGVFAVAYPGPYENLGLPEETEQLVYMDDDTLMQSGRDAHTAASAPVDEYAKRFGDEATDTYTANNANKLDLGAEGDMKVVLLEPKNGKVTISGQQTGSGVLVVDGDLHLAGQFSFSGLIIATGDVKIAGAGKTDRVLGALIAGGAVSIAGNGRVLYSTQKINDALEAAGISLDDLAQFLLPTSVGTPRRRAWIGLDDAMIRSEYPVPSGANEGGTAK